MTWKIPLFEIYWDKEDVESVAKAISAGMNWAVGPNIEHFEEALRDFIGSRYCATFNSGTSALHADLLSHGVERGKEVIVPSFTFIATANAPLFVGARPIFADIEEETLGLDPEDVVEKITSKTAALMPIHFGGSPCKIRELKEIADDHNILLIEDAAESLGAMIKDRKVGTFGDSAMFSFCQNKIITTGEGGAIVTDSEEVFARLKLIRSHGRLETANYFSTQETMDYIALGYNFRMSNLTAALGISQLKKIDKIIEMRRRKAELITSMIRGEVQEVEPLEPPDDYFHVYQMYTVKAKERDGLMKHLANNNIMTKIYFSPVHLTHFYRKVLGYDCKLPVTEEIATRVMALPFYPGLSEEDIKSIIKAINAFYHPR